MIKWNKTIISSCIMLIILCMIIFILDDKPVIKDKGGMIITPEPSPIVTIISSLKEKTYVNKDGKYSITYPQDFILHVNYVHVRNTTIYKPVRNIIELDSPKIRYQPYVLIGFSYSPRESLDDFVENSTECEAIEQSKGQDVVISGVKARMYKNVLCDSLETRIYLINKTIGYNIIINGAPVNESFLSDFLSKFKLL